MEETFTVLRSRCLREESINYCQSDRGNSMSSIIIKNANVYTMSSDDDNARATGVVVKGNRIVYVGDSKEAEKYIENDTRIIDAEGRMVMPGLIDAHAHPISTPYYNGIPLDIEQNFDEMIECIKEYIEAHPEKESYFGLGYDEDCPGPERYNKETLDAICPDKPLLMLGITMHDAWCNSKALEVAGIDKNFPDPAPGMRYFHRDAEGNPTGRISDSEPFAIVAEAIKCFDLEAAAKSFDELLASYRKLGITSIYDAGVFNDIFEADAFENVKKHEEEGTLTVRITGSSGLTADADKDVCIEHLQELHELYDSDKFRFTTLKILQDGCIEGRNSSNYKPWVDYGEMRAPFLEGEELDSFFLKTAEKGFDLHLHTLGDRAVHTAVESARAVREAGYKDTRITLAHDHMILDEDIPRFAKYDIIANSTPQWWVFKQCNVDALGEEAAKKLLRMKSLMNAGATFTIGSDFPSDEIGYEPFLAVEQACTRQHYGCPDEQMLEPASERLTVEEALRAYTINGAHQLRMEDKVGSIEEGKLADIIILEENPFDMDVYRIHSIKVNTTIFDGEIVSEGGALNE